MQSWALSKGSIQKAGVFYIKIFACNFRLHSKVCIFIEFLPLLPRNVTKSHQHTREICRGLFNIWHDVPPWCSLASPAYSVVALLCSVVVPPYHLSPLECLLMVRFWQEFVVNCLFLEVHLHWPNQRQFPWHLHTNPKESFAYMHKTVKHSNDHTFVGMDENLYDVVLQVELHHSCLCSVCLQNILRECTRASEWSTRSKTCWQRRGPGRQTDPDTAWAPRLLNRLSLPALLSSIKPNGTADLLLATGGFSKNKKTPLVYIEARFCALTIHGGSFDHLYLACKAIL